MTVLPVGAFRLKSPRGDWRQSGQLAIAVVSAFAIFLIHLSLTPVVLAQAESAEAANPAPRNVVAVVPRFWPPQYSVDESGQPTGFAIDVMNEIAVGAGLTVTYVIADNFSVAVDVLRRGDADLIPNSGILAERMDVFAFTTPVETFVVSLFVRNDTDDINDAADLVGRKLAVVEKNIGLIMFGERQDIQVQVYRDIRTALFHLIAGHVDALVYPQPLLLALSREIGVEGRIRVVGASLKEVRRGIRVMKDNVELLTVLNKAVERFVGTPEYQRIYTNWYGSPTQFWTVARVTRAMGTFTFVLLISMTWWRYHTVHKLNQDLERRVEERTADLRAAQADLLRQERMATLGQLAATISHELRNPLAVIQTSNFVVRDYFKDCDPRVGRSLERIEHSVIRCDRIIDEVLDFTRIRQFEPEPTPIDTWLDGVLEEQTLCTDITLRRDLGLPGVKVFLDHDRFRRAVINVFDNACQAMVGDGNGKIEEGEHILTIQTGKTNGRIEVVFEDNGPGIPPDVLSKIFEPMFSTKGFGVGLGLPVVKQIMEQHGGGIEIDSGQERGTRICLWLPSDDAVH